MENVKDLRAQVSVCLKNKNMEQLKQLISTAQDIELLHLYMDLTPNEQVLVFRLLKKEAALNIFEQLSTELQKQLLESFTDEQATQLVNEMTPDDRVALLEELPATIARKLLASLTPEEREVTNILMGYKEQTAGRIMTTEYISLRRNLTAEEAIAKVRTQAADKETVYILYVTDNAKKLEGVISLKDLIIAEPTARIEDIMFRAVISVSTNTDQEAVANTLKELDLLAIPVVDTEGRIVGIVTIDDAMDILEKEATEDILNQAGLVGSTSGGEENRSEQLVHGSLWAIWRVRLPFLIFTIIAGFAAGGVVDGFEEILEEVVAVAIFIPLIMDMGGNIGTQSSTVFARGVVLGHIRMDKFKKQLLKETGVGFSLGAVTGAVSGVIATLWQGEPMLGVAVGLSLTVVSTLAAFLGFVVPYFLMKLGLDQAAGSAPLITSVKDVVGLLVYFVLVSQLLAHLIY